MRIIGYPFRLPGDLDFSAAARGCVLFRFRGTGISRKG